MGIVLVLTGFTAAVIGAWRSYAMLRDALAPLVHGGEPTRTAIDAARPVYDRMRVRLFARRVMVSLGWLLVAFYGLFLLSSGTLVP
jgi:hypothetical protein